MRRARSILLRLGLVAIGLLVGGFATVSISNRVWALRLERYLGESGIVLPSVSRSGSDAHGGGGSKEPPPLLRGWVDPDRWPEDAERADALWNGAIRCSSAFGFEPGRIGIPIDLSVYDDRLDPDRESEREHLREVLAAVAPEMETLREIFGPDGEGFLITGDESDAFGVVRPFDGVLRAAPVLFAVSAALHLRAGESGRAVEDLEVISRITRSYDESSSYTLGLELHEISVIAMGIAEHLWRREDLVRLMEGLPSDRSLAERTVAILRHRQIRGIRSILWIRDHRWSRDPALAYVTSRSAVGLPPLNWFRVAPRGWFDNQAMRCGRIMDPIIEAASVARESADPASQDGFSELYRVAREEPPPSSGLPVVGQLGSWLAGRPVRLWRHLTFRRVSTRVCRLAMLAEVFRLEHGYYPPDADALQAAGALTADEMLDLASQGPLLYRRFGEGFVLYSKGWDADDDGGVPMVQDHGRPEYATSEGDWVWSMAPR